MYKAVFFDIDGTIISKKDNSIPKSFYDAIKKLKANNILCGIATGRHPIELEQEGLLDNIDFDIYVMLNGGLCFEHNSGGLCYEHNSGGLCYEHNSGGLCFEHNQVVYSKQIEMDTVKKMYDISMKEKTPLLFVEENDMYLNFVDESVIKAQNAIHTAVPDVKEVTFKNPVYQMCLFGNPQQKQLFEQFDNLNITRWHDLSYDVIDKDVTKINGIQKVLQTHNITLDEVMCFGDGDNDVSMFDGCGYAIALKDCSDLAREHANEITDSVEQDGVYKALKAHHLI